MGGHYLRRTERTGLGGDGESCPGCVWNVLQGLQGAILFEDPGALAWGGQGVLPRGCSELSVRAFGGHYLQRSGHSGLGGTGVHPRGCLKHPARPMGGQNLQRPGRTGLRGTGSPAQGVVKASCTARREPSSFKSRAHRPGGGRGVHPGGWPEHSSGVGGAPCLAGGGAAVLLVSAHLPGGGGGALEAGSNRGAPSGGACPAVRTRQLGGP